MLKDVVHAHTATKAAASRGAANAGMSVLVVTSALVLIAQHLIGLSSFLKLFFRLLIARIFIGVKLYGFLAVGLFDFVCGSILTYFQYFVRSEERRVGKECRYRSVSCR